MVISTTKAILFQMRFNNFWCNNLIGHKHKKKKEHSRMVMFLLQYLPNMLNIFCCFLSTKHTLSPNLKSMLKSRVLTTFLRKHLLWDPSIIICVCVCVCVIFPIQVLKRTLLLIYALTHFTWTKAHKHFMGYYRSPVKDRGRCER